MMGYKGAKRQSTRGCAKRKISYILMRRKAPTKSGVHKLTQIIERTIRNILFSNIVINDYIFGTLRDFPPNVREDLHQKYSK